MTGNDYIAVGVAMVLAVVFVFLVFLLVETLGLIT